MRCNLHCTMCPWHEMRSANADMAWETYEKIAAHFHDAREVDLTGGGEPLMHPQLLRMIALAKQSGCAAGFSTNATLLTSQLSEELIHLDLDWIAYSLDGATPHTYEQIRRGASFERVMEQVRFLDKLRKRGKRKKPLTMLFFVMMPNNVHELSDLVDLCLHLGIDRLVLKNQDVILKMERDRERLFTWGPHKSGESERIIGAALEKAKSNGLYARVYDLLPKEMTICEQDPLNTAFFNWEGFVSPCITLAYAEKRVFRGEWTKAPICRFGHITKETFTQIWAAPDYRRFRSYFEKRHKSMGQGFLDLLTLEGFPTRRDNRSLPLPPPPDGCETCYYLYGI
ncbi:MAG: radical SAM/SPASM domain-containing protein [Candidatus Binatia bacterium]